MSSVDTGGNAFPTTEDIWSYNKGMTLRDYFAAKAMNAVLSNSGGAIQSNDMSGWSLCNCEFSDVAKFAYQMADAMLAARNN